LCFVTANTTNNTIKTTTIAITAISIGDNLRFGRAGSGVGWAVGVTGAGVGVWDPFDAGIGSKLSEDGAVGAVGEVGCSVEVS